MGADLVRLSTVRHLGADLAHGLPSDTKVASNLPNASAGLVRRENLLVTGD
jgi:hypothetical protein